MSFREKLTWVCAIGSLVVFGAYFVVISGRLGDVPATDVPYVGALLTAIGAYVVVQIVGAIGAAISAPDEADLVDERDRRIHRHGELIGGVVLGAAIVVPLGLTLAGFAHFWIANAIFAAYVLATLASSTSKLVGYRRGV